MLALAGAVLGVALARLLMPILRALVPPIVPRADEISIDWTVLAFAGAVTVLSALVCGLAPIWHARQKDLQAGLRQSSGAITGDRRVVGWRRTVVAAQVSIVFALLIVASLLLHSFWRMQHVDLGFIGDGLITMEMRLLNPKYRQPGRMHEFQEQIMERIRAIPGVQQASMTSSVPMRGVDFTVSITYVGGTEQKAANRRPVDPEYFALMRIPLEAGRLLTKYDDAHATKVAVVSQAFARSLFGDENPLGRQLDFQSGPIEIVGIVGDVRHVDVTRPPFPALYVPRAQDPTELICLVVRPIPGASGVPAAVRAAVQSVDPEQPVEKVTTLDRIVRESTADERFYIVSTAGFAAVAVLLAILGLAGVVSRTVTERVREIAIRLSLGAEPRSLLRQTVRHGMIPVVVGLVVGALGAWAASRLLVGFLFEVSPADPFTYAVAAVILAAASVAACYVPARRATRIEPMAALKVD
jgi:putative ABC transport system permease protein